MKQYLDLLSNILEHGIEKESGRENMPNTIGISNGIIKMNLSEGFPLLTTKKMYFKGIIHELLWFLRGDTNIKYLVDNNVNIWNGDAYRWYLKYCEDYKIEIYFKTQEDFIEYFRGKYDGFYPQLKFHILDLRKCGYEIGDLGKVYGYQWRNQNGVDQVRDVIEGLKTNPYSRYHIIDGWNKSDFNDMALPPCHLLYQFIVRPMTQEERVNFYFEKYKPPLSLIRKDVEKILENAFVPKFYLDLNMYQRSCDTFLGVPFNLASMSLLLMIISKTVNMIPGEVTWIGGDTHLYLDHIPQVKEQLKREPKELPELLINKKLNSLEDILNLEYKDFKLTNYESYPVLKAKLFTGV